jgi:2-iminobutanoate/2-iminopropanoate deaminase
MSVTADRAAFRLNHFRGALPCDLSKDDLNELIEYRKTRQVERDKLTVGASIVNGLGDILETMAHTPIKKRAIVNRDVLNEASEYAKPSSFSRGMRIDLNGLAILLISGTASINECGKTVHIGDFRAQLRRTFSNITGLLASEGATWHDIVRTTCYLRDIDRDYDVFNEERTAFFKEQGLDPLPASTGIQARLCRPELLVEIEAIAMFRTEKLSVRAVGDPAVEMQ